MSIDTEDVRVTAFQVLSTLNHTASIITPKVYLIKCTSKSENCWWNFFWVFWGFFTFWFISRNKEHAYLAGILPWWPKKSHAPSGINPRLLVSKWSVLRKWIHYSFDSMAWCGFMPLSHLMRPGVQTANQEIDRRTMRSSYLPEHVSQREHIFWGLNCSVSFWIAALKPLLSPVPLSMENISWSSGPLKGDFL